MMMASGTAPSSSVPPSVLPPVQQRHDQENPNDRENSSPRPRILEIPLLSPPPIDCSNLGSLEQTSYINIVLEEENNESRRYFRISDDKNKDVCRITIAKSGQEKERRKNIGQKGITYLECIDTANKPVLFIGYPVGLGEVALLSTNNELIGECQPSVEFQCLSVKVKYNYYDANGIRQMKMTSITPDKDNGRGKFVLMVKRSKDERLALIKMGALRKCGHVKFKRDVATITERIQILALWIGFMHNEMEDTVTPDLIEKQEKLKEIKRSQRKQSVVNEERNNTDENMTSSQPQTRYPGSKLKALKIIINTRLKRINDLSDDDHTGKNINNNLDDRGEGKMSVAAIENA